MLNSLKTFRLVLSKPRSLLAKLLELLEQRILKYPLYALGIFSCTLLAWSVWYLLQKPDTGFLWELSSGRVRQVFPGSPAQNLLRPGDVILSMDGKPVSEAFLLPQKSAGEALLLVFERDGRVLSAEIPLGQPTPASLLNALANIPVAATFCILGIFLLIFMKAKLGEVAIFLFIQWLTLNLNPGKYITLSSALGT